MDFPRRAFGRRTLLKSTVTGATVAAAAGCTPDGKQAEPEPKQKAPEKDVHSFHSRPDLRPVTVHVRTRSPQSGHGLIFVDTHSGPGQQGPMIVDGQGELVWFKPLSDDATPAKRAFTFRVQQYGGRPVLTWFEGRVVDGHGQGEYVLADDSYREIRRVRAGNGFSGDLHEFLLTDRGTALFTCYGDAATTSGSHGRVKYYRGIVQEVDIATGKVLFQWRSDDHVGLEDSYTSFPTDGTTMDYFHINSIAVDDDGDLLVSSRNTWCIYKVSRRTGDIVWRLGGKRSDFDVPADAHFAWQHHVVSHPCGVLTVFDNEAAPAEAKQSRALVLDVDQKNRTVRLKNQYRHQPGVLAYALGSVQILPSGNIFVGWGTVPYVTEYTPDGTVVFDAELAGSGTLDYRAFRQPWSARPQGSPDVTVEKAGSGHTAYVSWNGATDVTHWRLLAVGGSDTPLRTVARSGFETAIPVPDGNDRIAVEALSGDGHVLGRSADQRLG